MTQTKGACCSSPASICYWCSASLVAWGALSVIGIYWHPIYAPSATRVLLAMAFGCAANWLRNRTFHCAISGPVFLIGAFLFVSSDVTTFRVKVILVWTFVLIG